jgi:hypothetical protein
MSSPISPYQRREPAQPGARSYYKKATDARNRAQGVRFNAQGVHFNVLQPLQSLTTDEIEPFELTWFGGLRTHTCVKGLGYRSARLSERPGYRGTKQRPVLRSSPAISAKRSETFGEMPLLEHQRRMDRRTAPHPRWDSWRPAMPSRKRPGLRVRPGPKDQPPVDPLTVDRLFSAYDFMRPAPEKRGA